MFTHLPGTSQEWRCAPELPLKFIFLQVCRERFCPEVAEIQYPPPSGVCGASPDAHQPAWTLFCLLSALIISYWDFGSQTDKAGAPGGAWGRRRGNRAGWRRRCGRLAPLSRTNALSTGADVLHQWKVPPHQILPGPY